MVSVHVSIPCAFHACANPTVQLAKMGIVIVSTAVWGF